MSAAHTLPIQGPAVILIRGLPGSGKTYLAEALQVAIGAASVVMLDPDTIDRTSEKYVAHTKALTAEGVEAKFWPYRFLRAQAHQGIADHKIIIWNQPFTLPGGFQRTIQSLREFAQTHDIELPILSVEVMIDATTAKQRIEQRKTGGGHGPSDGRFAQFIDDYYSLTDMGQDQTITVQGADDVQTSVSAVVNAVHSLQA